VSSTASGLTVAPYRAAQDAEAWDELIGRSRASHFLFRRSYMDYHADRYTDASLVVRRGGRVVAVLPASRREDVVTSHGMLTFGGLQTDERPGAEGVLRMLELVLEALQADGVARLIYKPVPHIYHRVPAEEDLYALWRLGATLTRREIAASVRLDQPPSYGKARRHAVRRAQAAGLEVARSDDWDAFMDVERQTLERHGAVPVHIADELRLLAGRFPDQISLTVARKAGELVAGVVVYATPHVAHAQYIGSTASGRAVSAVDVVVDALIQRHAAAGRRWFDFGISTADAGRTLNAGLAAYKESFGARGVAYDTYAIDVDR
jgi:hypothetical protein